MITGNHRITVIKRVGERSESLQITDQTAAPRAGLDQAVAALAAQDGTTKGQRNSDSRHRQHTALHRRAGHLEHWELEQVGHFEVVHMIAGYSADSDHCIDHHDSLRRLTGGSFLPIARC